MTRNIVVLIMIIILFVEIFGFTLYIRSVLKSAKNLKKRYVYSPKISKLMQHINSLEIPLIPIVEEGVCKENIKWSLGYITDTFVDEYLKIDDQICLRSTTNAEELLQSFYKDSALPESRAERQVLTAKLPWQKAIIIKVSAKSTEEQTD